MEMLQKSTSMILKYIFFDLWILLTITIASTSAIRFLDEQTVDPMLPQGAPTPKEHNDLTFSFFMHDAVGGSNPSARPVTGIVDNSLVNSQLLFPKPNGAVLPFNNYNNNDNNNNDNIPFMTGLSGTTSNIFQNNGMMKGARLPVGSTIEKLVFGTMTVVDDELTRGPEMSSGRVGKAQGFYVASSSGDGTTSDHVIALTAMFKSGGYVDTICFFGVHLLGVSESQVAIMGGTGKFASAKGYAIIKTLQTSTNDQHQIDGVETVLQFTVYVTY